MSQEFDKMQMGNPLKIKIQAEIARAGHFGVCRNTLEMLDTKKVFEGGDDHTACTFGKWLGEL